MGLLDDLYSTELGAIRAVPGTTRANYDRLKGLLGVDSTGNGLLSDLNYGARNALSQAKWNAGNRLDKIQQYLTDPSVRNQPSTPESRASIDEALMNLGSSVMPGAMAGTFISREGAKRIGKEALLDKALLLHRKGADPKSYWEETKTFIGPDEQPWMEVPDNALKMNGAARNDLLNAAWKEGGIDALKTAKTELEGYEQPYLEPRVRDLGEVVSHPELQSIYPEIFQYSRYQMNPNMKIGEGSYSNYRNLYSMGPANEQTARSVMAHELQHGIQHEEDGATGGNPGQMPLLLRNEAYSLKNEADDWLKQARANDPLDPGKVLKPGLQKKALRAEKRANDYVAMADRIESMGGAFPAYQNLWGEAMARLAEKRLDYSPEERIQIHPFDDLDIDPRQAIIIRPKSLSAFRQKSLLED